MKRKAIPIVLLIIIAVASIGPASNQVTANQQGPGVGDQLTGWAILCGLHGGRATVDVPERTVGGLSSGAITCNGGLLGGLTCFINANPKLSLCDHPASSMQGSSSQPATGIDPASLPIITTLPTTSLTEGPAMTEEMPLVFDAQVAWPTSEGAMQGVEVAQVHACTLGGGETTATTRLPDVESAATIRCDGGVLDGYTCDFVVGLVTCFTDTSTMPVTQPTQASAPSMPGTSETTATAPSDSTEPTEPAVPTVPMEPTMAPTDEPVIEPTFPPATDAGPWTVPEGTLRVFEPVEPTPTEVILT